MGYKIGDAHCKDTTGRRFDTNQCLCSASRFYGLIQAPKHFVRVARAGHNDIGGHAVATARGRPPIMLPPSPPRTAIAVGLKSPRAASPLYGQPGKGQPVTLPGPANSHGRAGLHRPAAARSPLMARHEPVNCKVQ